MEVASGNAPYIQCNNPVHAIGPIHGNFPHITNVGFAENMNKTFKLSAEEIKELIPHIGGCYATDKITVLGEKVGYMFREQPDMPEDSGWRFFSGTETQEYVDDPSNTMMYAVNTIANYDPEIIPHLDSPIDTAYGRDPDSGQLIEEEFEAMEEAHPTIEPAHGLYGENARRLS